MKLAVVQHIRDFCAGGGFLFAMCSGTDTFDIALASSNTDIVESMFDGDPPTRMHNQNLILHKPSLFRILRSIKTQRRTSLAISMSHRYGR
jgi:hypothetical protein